MGSYEISSNNKSVKVVTRYGPRVLKCRLNYCTEASNALGSRVRFLFPRQVRLKLKGTKRLILMSFFPFYSPISRYKNIACNKSCGVNKTGLCTCMYSAYELWLPLTLILFIAEKQSIRMYVLLIYTISLVLPLTHFEITFLVGSDCVWKTSF